MEKKKDFKTNKKPMLCKSAFIIIVSIIMNIITVITIIIIINSIMVIIITKSKLSLYSLHYAEACYELVGPILFEMVLT